MHNLREAICYVRNVQVVKMAVDNIFQRFCCQYPLIIYPAFAEVKPEILFVGS